MDAAVTAGVVAWHHPGTRTYDVPVIVGRSALGPDRGGLRPKILLSAILLDHAPNGEPPEGHHHQDEQLFHGVVPFVSNTGPVPVNLAGLGPGPAYSAAARSRLAHLRHDGSASGTCADVGFSQEVHRMPPTLGLHAGVSRGSPRRRPDLALRLAARSIGSSGTSAALSAISRYSTLRNSGPPYAGNASRIPTASTS